MTARFEAEDGAVINRTECDNCGATGNLLRCSRCHAAWFCSLKCHKAYWPFHKSTCKRNDFADAVEEQEPKFAAWMRKHGKLAVLQDDEVDRLERSGKPGGWRGLSRDEVMQSMYGRLDPRPTAPEYGSQGAHRSASEPMEANTVNREAVVCKAWQDITVPQDLGLALTHYKWRQNLSHVELFVRLPDGCTARQVQVKLRPGSLELSVAGFAVLTGQLSADVKVEDSTWYCDQGIVYMVLLKRNRKGHYADGSTAASTFWYSLLAGAQGVDRLQLEHPPNQYYTSPYEADDLGAAN